MRNSTTSNNATPPQAATTTTTMCAVTIYGLWWIINPSIDDDYKSNKILITELHEKAIEFAFQTIRNGNENTIERKHARMHLKHWYEKPAGNIYPQSKSIR